MTSVWRQIPGYPPHRGLLLLHLAVDVKALLELGKKYPWEKPGRCPKCEGIRLWGHGYEERYFEGVEGQVWMKRYRCPDCNAVHTCRLLGYWRLFRHPVSVIAASLTYKLIHGRWLKGLLRQTQQYWRRLLWRHASRHEIPWTLTMEHLREFLCRRL